MNNDETPWWICSSSFRLNAELMSPSCGCEINCTNTHVGMFPQERKVSFGKQQQISPSSWPHETLWSAAENSPQQMHHFLLFEEQQPLTFHHPWMVLADIRWLVSVKICLLTFRWPLTFWPSHRKQQLVWPKPIFLKTCVLMCGPITPLVELATVQCIVD